MVSFDNQIKGGISIDTDSEPLGYFDAVVLEVKTFFTFFRLALAILNTTTNALTFWTHNILAIGGVMALLPNIRI